MRLARVKAACWLLLNLLLVPAPAALAEQVSHDLGPARQGLADYRPGEPGQPALLLLHGFLQTHEFGLIQSLMGELADNGYTVLAPTLTLGITQRKQSLACEAIHTHRFEDGVAELGAWVAWLRARGHRHIVLISHSSSGAHLIDYIRRQPAPEVRQAILLSLGTFLDREGRQALATELPHAAQTGELSQHTLVFCKGNYTATAAAVGSYLRWDPTAILAGLRQSRVPTTLILGSADRYLPRDWVSRLRAQGQRVHLVKGADHFFSGTQEFALFDALHATLKAAR